MAFKTRQEQVQQGVEWLNKNRNHLIEVIRLALVNHPDISFKDEPFEYQYEVARDSLENLIKRLEGEIFAVDKVKQQFMEILKLGVLAKSLINIADMITDSLKSETRKGLKAQPSVVEALVERMDYTNMLTKSAIASAQIEFITQQLQKK
ncbi:MAG TPA: hypothetical protein VH186_31690 [Chloroflexia bacterium]|nr:hypothetical protein [Chloroflexia bacterium]